MRAGGGGRGYGARPRLVARPSVANRCVHRCGLALPLTSPPLPPSLPPSRHRHSPHSRLIFLPRHGHWLRCQRRLLCPRAGACALVASYISLHRRFTCRFYCGFGCRPWVSENPCSPGPTVIDPSRPCLEEFLDFAVAIYLFTQLLRPMCYDSVAQMHRATD